MSFDPQLIATAVNVAALGVNLFIAFRLARVSQAFEREKLHYSRGETLFKRQIEALDEVAKIVAEPMNLASGATYVEGRGMVLRPGAELKFDDEQYVRVATEHFYPLGAAMVGVVDELHAKGWELLAELTTAPNAEAYTVVAGRMDAHRAESLRIVEDYLNERIAEPLKPIDQGETQKRLHRALRTITEQAPSMKAARMDRWFGGARRNP
jgi:hypothetical protein